MIRQAPLSDIEAQALRDGDPQGSLEALRGLLQDDPRPGAKKLLEKYEKKAAKSDKESARLERLLLHEKEALSKDCRTVAGVDEAGRGPLAGAVVAAAVILDLDKVPPGLNDSKKLSPEKRGQLEPLIREKAVAVSVGSASAQEIDEINIYRAARLAMERAVEGLGTAPGFLLTDAMPLPKFGTIPQKSLVHGDALSASIAAASIVAKVTRDRMMGDLHDRYPQYGFQGHKGYGTEAHLAALKEHGPCPEHRRTFAPVMEVLAGRESGGPFAYWSGKLQAAKDPRDLHQVGLQIKRVALSSLSQEQLDRLRDLFRGKRSQLG
jgi:ribonuclease HII